MCDAQKEIGIDMCFKMIKNGLSSSLLLSAVNPKSYLDDVLVRCREDCLELLYRNLMVGEKGMYTALNTHPLLGLRNAIGERVGLSQIQDSHSSLAKSIDLNEAVERFFKKFYHPKILIGEVSRALNDMPRKIPYNPVIGLLKNSISRHIDVEQFLYGCFDDNGKFTDEAVIWILFKFGHFKLSRPELSDEVVLRTLFPGLMPLKTTIITYPWDVNKIDVLVFDNKLCPATLHSFYLI